MNLLAHGSGDWHDVWISAAPFAVSGVVYLWLRARQVSSKPAEAQP